MPALDLPPSGNDLLINTIDASHSATNKLNSTQPIAETQEPGKGEVNNASTWDEFPIGWFGDYKSPAFGTQSDPWNSGTGVIGAHFLKWFLKTTTRVLILRFANSELSRALIIGGARSALRI